MELTSYGWFARSTSKASLFTPGAADLSLSQPRKLVANYTSTCICTDISEGHFISYTVSLVLSGALDFDSRKSFRISIH